MVLSGAGDTAGQSSDYRVVPVVNGRTIKGTVKWSGPEPHLPNLPITKDSQICGHKTRDLERLVIGPQGGVANTVVFIKIISSGKAFDLPPGRGFLDQHLCRSDATLHTIPMDGAATYNLPFPFTNQTVSPTHEPSRIGRTEMQWRTCLDECRDVRGAPSVRYRNRRKRARSS
jgi:hypothetical protein